jgi:prevent-host-death family protein
VLKVNLAEAKSRLSELVDAALAGDDVVIARRGKPLVRLAPLNAARIRPEPGRFKGRIDMAPDFDEALDDFREYVE